MMNQYKKIILEHNIPLYLCIDPYMKNTFVSYSVKYGSSGLWFRFHYNGKDYQVGSGYAHYLEHLLGEHGPFGNMYQNFAKRFLNTNAYTAPNFTSYFFKGKDNIEKSIEELILSMEQPVFDQKDVDATRHAIDEEAATSCNDYDVKAVYLVENNLFDGFSKFDETLSPIGSRETTKAINIDDLYLCYNAFYADNNKFMVVAGNVDEKQIVNCINNALQKVPKHDSHFALPPIDFRGMKTDDDVIYRDILEPISALGIKVKKPDNLSMKEFDYVMAILDYYAYYSKQVNELKRNGILDTYKYCYYVNVADYLNFIVSFITKDKYACAEGLIELFCKKDLSKQDYELMRKAIVASEVRAMDNKYDYVKAFPDNIYCSEEYSDIDFYQSVSYDRFSTMLDELDFSQHTIGEVKQFIKQ